MDEYMDVLITFLCSLLCPRLSCDKTRRDALLPVRQISNIYGTVKAYCTRVGEGPFPTETLDATGDTLR